MTQPVGYVTPRQVLGYVRVSKETEAGLSIDAQSAKIRAMAVVRDYALTEVLVDNDASGKTIDRPAMLTLLDRVNAGLVDTVLVAKLDRLTRSLVDLDDVLGRFERRKVTLVSLAESLDTRSAVGRMVINIMMSVSQGEREMIGERTRDVLQHKKAKGERVGQLPFGFQLAGDGDRLEPNPLEQDKIARIRNLKATGHSARQIAADFNARGMTTRRGGPWRFEYVARVLRKERAS